MLRVHWVMEFQRRGVPHLHAAIWFDDRDTGTVLGNARMLAEREYRLKRDWVDLTEGFRALMISQHVRVIDAAVGWFEYLAKHCSRGKYHYQRQRESVPKAWESSGRVWGHSKGWATQGVETRPLSKVEFHRLRRLVRARRVAEARRGLPLNAKQFGRCRRLLKCGQRKASEVRPVSEWMPESEQARFAHAARRRFTPPGSLPKA